MSKAFIKLLINLHSFFYKLTGGVLGGQMGAYKILLLTTRGRKSGREFTTPLGYFDHQGGYLIIASNGGQDKGPDWYFNLTSDPQVRIQIKDQIFNAQAQVLDGETRTPVWDRIVAEAPQYGQYEKRTDRLIPVVWLRPSLELQGSRIHGMV